MSFIKITPENLETFSLTLHPSRSFTSSSSGTVNGTVFLVPRPSSALKDVSFINSSTGWDENAYAKETQLDKFSEKFLADEKVRLQNPSGKDNVNAAAGTGFTAAYPSTNYLSYFDRLYRDPPARGSTLPSAAKYGGYLYLVNSTGQTTKNSVSRNIRAFQPGFQYCSLKNNAYAEQYDGKDRSLKETIVNCLYPAYSDRPGQYVYGFTNYNSLNFFTASSVSSQAAFIYPDDTGSCIPGDEFTLSFFINPRYTTENSLNSSIRNVSGGRFDSDGSIVFKAGTIFQVSSSIVVSLVTGSALDSGGFPSSYRVMLQLSHSAGIDPDSLSLTSSNGTRPDPENLVFLSDDFQITRNNWSHVSIKWSSKKNNSTGSISIDSRKTYFNVKASAGGGQGASLGDITRTSVTPYGNLPGEVFIGAFYKAPASATPDNFFNTTAATSYGLTTLTDDYPPSPFTFTFTNLLNAEIHDVRYHNRCLSDAEQEKERLGEFIDDASLKFFVPPSYVTLSPTIPFTSRRSLNNTENAINTQNSAPFDKFISGRTGGRIISVKSYSANVASFGYKKTTDSKNRSVFTKLERQPVYPRLYGIEDIDAFNYAAGSENNANDYIVRSTTVNRANHTITPCDDGSFKPRFGYMVTESLWSIDRFGNRDPSYVDLRNIYDSSTDLKDTYETRTARDINYVDNYLNGVSPIKGEFTNGPNGSTKNGSILPGGGINPVGGPVVTPILTNDLSSDEITIFNISNLFYGDRIFPGSLVIREASVPGSSGRMKFTLKDDGLGNIYRADSGTKLATWNSVGNVFYDEGFIVIKSPNLYLFGRNGFSIEFKGQRNMHVLTINVPCDQGTFNASSNASYRDVPASLDFNEQDPSFVYITGITLHDDNLNVIMRANLAQPLKKRNSDEYLFRIKQDF